MCGRQIQIPVLSYMYIYVCISMLQNMFPNVTLLKETKEGGKKEKNDDG
jgi:hypothetical protein